MVFGNQYEVNQCEQDLDHGLVGAHDREQDVRANGGSELVAFDQVLRALDREMDQGPRSSGAGVVISDQVLEAHIREMGLDIPSSRPAMVIADPVFEAHTGGMDQGIQKVGLELVVSCLVFRAHSSVMDLDLLVVFDLGSRAHSEVEVARLVASGLVTWAQEQEQEQELELELAWACDHSLGLVFF